MASISKLFSNWNLKQKWLPKKIQSWGMKKVFRWNIRIVWVALFSASLYAFYVYFQMNNAQNHAHQIVTLHNSAQHLRKCISSALLKQEQHLVELSEEINYFRYLLLNIKSHSIHRQWNEIHQLLLDADVFIEDVDNLMSSIYSISRVTNHLQSLMENDISAEMKEFIQYVSTYLLFEFHGLNDNELATEIRFNQFIEHIESKFEQLTSESQRIEIFTLYTGLQKMHHQLGQLDDIINHHFIHTVNTAQVLRTSLVLSYVDQLIEILFILVVLVVIQFGLYRGKDLNKLTGLIDKELKEIQQYQITPQIKSSIEMKTDDLKIYNAEMLREQLDDSADAVLTIFISDHQDDANHLKQSLAQADQITARTIVHSLKGVAGNIGAESLEYICRLIESEIRANRNIEPQLFNEFEKTLNMTIQQITKALEQSHQQVTI